MTSSYNELKELFANFQWIDDIPEDQAKRDEICLEAKAALLIEANCTSERFPAFICWLSRLLKWAYSVLGTISFRSRSATSSGTVNCLKVSTRTGVA